jgi:hypothetical protein
MNFTKGDNHKKCYILQNEAFTLGLRKKNTLKIENFGVIDANATQILYNLTYSDVAHENGIKSIESIEQICGVPIGRILYRDLTGLVNASQIKYGNMRLLGISPKTFFENLKKGSKRIRKYLEADKNDFVPHNIVKYAENTDIVIGLEACKKLNRMWTEHYLSNATRTFHFKLINNVLGLNYIISHFVPGVDRNCTLCDVDRNPVPEDETPLHLFYSCNITENLLIDFFALMGTTFLREEFFSIPTRQLKEDNLVIILTSILVKKFIWDCKMRYCLPTIDQLTTFVFRELTTMCHISKKVKMSVKNCGFSFYFRNGCLGEDT